MAGHSTPGPTGMGDHDSEHGDDLDPREGRRPAPGPIGLDAGGPRVVRRIVTRIVKDWDPPKPKSTPDITVRGRTLEEVARELSTLPEWGEGGGRIRSEKIPAGTSEEVTARLSANLVKRLPRWARYREASAAAKEEWDRMMAVLTAHEDRHVEIAIEEADRCASELIGAEVGEVADIVTEANRRMAERQSEYDDQTENGRLEGVELDFSIE
jgi:hypothetical protein